MKKTIAILSLIVLVLAGAAYARMNVIGIAGVVADGGCTDNVGESGDGDSVNYGVQSAGGMLAMPITTDDCAGVVALNLKIRYLLNNASYKGRVALFSNKSNYSGESDGPDALLWESADYLDTSASDPWIEWYRWQTTYETQPQTKYWVVLQGQNIGTGIRNTTGSSGRVGWVHTGTWVDDGGFPETFPDTSPTSMPTTYIPHVYLSY